MTSLLKIAAPSFRAVIAAKDLVDVDHRPQDIGFVRQHDAYTTRL